MTIEELKERKRALEWDIYALLKEFERECNLKVGHVTTMHTQNFEDEFEKIAFVIVEVTV